MKGEFNEVIFATFLPARVKSKSELVSIQYFTNTLLVITLLRVFMNHESPIAYKMLFTYVFKLLEDVLGTPIQFHYLHNSGFQAIVVDMDYKQMKGMSTVNQLETSFILIQYQFRAWFIPSGAGPL